MDGRGAEQRRKNENKKNKVDEEKRKLDGHSCLERARNRTTGRYIRATNEKQKRIFDFYSLSAAAANMREVVHDHFCHSTNTRDEERN